MSQNNSKKITRFTGQCKSCGAKVEGAGKCPTCGAFFRADGSLFFIKPSKAVEKPLKAVEPKPSEAVKKAVEKETPKDESRQKAVKSRSKLSSKNRGKAVKSRPGPAGPKTAEPAPARSLWKADWGI